MINSAPSEEISSDVLSNLPYGTPVISCWLPGEVEAAKHLGVIQYLVKPLTREKLLTTLEQLHIDIKRILVVDDQADELHLFARMLESDQQGYQIIQVTNGKRALSMMRSRKPDVVLLDLVMPVMDGFQVLEEKRKDPELRDIPVIVISSRDPTGETIISNSLKLACGSGFSARNLLDLIQAVGEIFTPVTPQITSPSPEGNG